MSSLLKVAFKVISRRSKEGEKLDQIFLDYPKMKQEEKDLIKELIVQERVQNNLLTKE